jgi:hypothetical protein
LVPDWLMYDAFIRGSIDVGRGTLAFRASGAASDVRADE